MDVDHWPIFVGVVIAAVLAYATFVVEQPLLGVFAAALLYLCAWLFARFFPGKEFRTPVSTLRGVLTAGLIVAIVGYSLFITAQFLLGAIVAVVVLLVSWTTSPHGPLAT